MLVPALDTATAPPHPPDPEPPLAVHELAPVEFHASAVNWPAWIVAGVAEKLVIAAGAGFTVSDAVAVPAAAPPEPVQFNVYE